MSRISKAILKTLLEEITDYEQVNLTKAEFKELKTICSQWEDNESIEIEINRFLIKLGYTYDDAECIWVSPKKLVDREQFLDWFLQDAEDMATHREFIVNKLADSNQITTEDFFSICGYIPNNILVEPTKNEFAEFTPNEDCELAPR